VAGQVDGSFAGIGWDDVAAKSCLNGFETGLGREYTAQQLVPVPATDMSGPLARLRRDEPAGLAVMAAGQTPGLIARQARSLRWDVEMFGWGGYAGSDDFPKVAGPAADGFKLVGTFAPDLREAQETKDFVEEFEAKHGNTPTEFEAAGYDAALLALAALREAGTDREKINDFLHNVKDFPAAAADLTIGPDGNVKRDVYVSEWREGKLVGQDTIEDGSVLPEGVAPE